MSSIVLENSFKTLSPFINALVKICLRHSVPLSPQSKFQLVNVLKLALQVNCVYQLRHHTSRWNKTTTSPQMCCSVTLRKLDVELRNFRARHLMQMWCKIIYLWYLPTRDFEYCFICLNRLINNIPAYAKLIWSQKRRMLWVVHATGQWIRQWRVVKCCSASR